MIADWTWVQLLTTVSGLYTLAIAVFLIRDNRSPQSTFAWLFLMLVFPIGGVIIYTLFGRGWKAFSRKNQLHSLMEGTSLADRRTAFSNAKPAFSKRFQTMAPANTAASAKCCGLRPAPRSPWRTSSRFYRTRVTCTRSS